MPTITIPELVKRAQGYDEHCRSKRKRGGPMWHFVRYIKGHLPDYDAVTAAALIDRVPYAWDLDGAPDDPRAEFERLWRLVTVPYGADVIAIAVTQANKRPLKPNRSHSHRYAGFISICGQLQKSMGEKSIAIPIAAFADVLSLKDDKMVSTYKQWAIEDGLLELVSAHIPHKRAAHYRFKTELFDWNTGKQIAGIKSVQLPPEDLLIDSVEHTDYPLGADSPLGEQYPVDGLEGLEGLCSGMKDEDSNHLESLSNEAHKTKVKTKSKSKPAGEEGKSEATATPTPKPEIPKLKPKRVDNPIDYDARIRELQEQTLKAQAKFGQNGMVH